MYILSVLFLFASCLSNEEAKKERLIFYYEDGKEIADSLTIKMITAELDSVLQHHKNETLKIYTSLPSKRIDISQQLDSIRAEIKTDLLERNEKFRDQIEQLPQDQLLNVALFAVENKTGKVLLYQNDSQQFDDLSTSFPAGSARKIYGMLMALDKEYAPDDEYVYMSRFGSEDRDSTRISLKSLFGISTGIILQYPFDEYTSVEWYNANRRMHFNADVQVSTRNDKTAYPMTNVMNLTRTFATINNEGNYRKIPLILAVKSSKGKTLFKQKYVSTKAISDETNAEMLELLDFYKTEGMGRFIFENLRLTDASTLFFGGSNSNICFYLCSTDRYTFGVIIRLRAYERTSKNRIKRYRSSPNSPHIICLPFIKLILKEFP